jgi:hypothetical protein
VEQVTEPQREVIRHNWVAYSQHVWGPWTFVQLRDGSEWMATPCRYEDGRNCWWNAALRGNGEGRSFLSIRGHRHYVRGGTVVGTAVR